MGARVEIQTYSKIREADMHTSAVLNTQESLEAKSVSPSTSVFLSCSFPYLSLNWIVV